MSQHRISSENLRSPWPRLLVRLIALVVLAASAPAGAITFTVTTTADTISGSATSGSLRDGIIAVNASSDASNSILFGGSLPGNAHIVLGSPLPFGSLDHAAD